MKLLLALVAAGAMASAADDPRLRRVQAVYLLPMSNGMDQYLAAWLTKRGVFQVVADPDKADAVFTDRLGESFETKMKELYPAEEPGAEGEHANNLASASRIESTWGRGRGNFFIVDRKSKSVLWSIYERPKGASTIEQHKTAGKVILRLQRDLTAAKAGS